MAKEKKIISGILFLFVGFFILTQSIQGSFFIGLAVSAIGLFLILSSLN